MTIGGSKRRTANFESSFVPVLNQHAMTLKATEPGIYFDDLATKFSGATGGKCA